MTSNCEQSRQWILESFQDWNDLFGVPPTVADWSPSIAKANGMAYRTKRCEETGRSWPNPRVVHDVFGSWNAGRVAAGFDTFPQGRQGRDGDDPRIREETVRLYRSGLSGAEVGELMGVSKPAIYCRLIAAGEPRRSRGRPKVKA